MKKLLPLLWLLAGSPAFAALSIVSGHVVQGNPPGTCAISSSVSAGQVVVAIFQGPTAAPSVTDNVNTGSYSVLNSWSANVLWVEWKVTTASGTPTLTSGSTGAYSYFQCFAITGFVGIPTEDSAINAHSSGTGVALTISSASNFTNEMLLIDEYAGNGFPAVTVSGWTAAGGADNMGFYAFEASSGTANNFSGTIASSQSWQLVLSGIYDAASSICTHAGITSGGAIAVPTAGSTVVRLKNGSLGTVDCSTMSYFQTQGNFGVN